MGCFTENSKTTKVEQGRFVDSRDGLEYRWIEINGQKWMGQDLKYQGLDSKCYKDYELNCRTEAVLYDWNQALNVCPIGWDLPSESDWDILLASVDGDGNALKSTSGWGGSFEGTDEIDFSVYPIGYYDSEESNYTEDKSYTAYWTSDASDNTDHYEYELDAKSIKFGINGEFQFVSKRGNYFSVRCIANNDFSASNSSELNSSSSGANKEWGAYAWPSLVLFHLSQDRVITEVPIYGTSISDKGENDARVNSISQCAELNPVYNASHCAARTFDKCISIYSYRNVELNRLAIYDVISLDHSVGTTRDQVEELALIECEDKADFDTEIYDCHIEETICVNQN